MILYIICRKHLKYRFKRLKEVVLHSSISIRQTRVFQIDGEYKQLLPAKLPVFDKFSSK